jgi:serine/threonine protein kinase
MATATSTFPRDLLLNMTIKGGWKLTEKLEKKTGDSGGNFGSGYMATRGSGELAFVKAIDYWWAMHQPDIASSLLQLTKEFQFEREVLEFCTARGMTKVLRFYGHDEVSADGTPNPMMKVSLLIMEAGDKDLRRLVNTNGAGTTASCAWNLFIISDIVQAVAQLHAGGIAHHDVKPSNVIAVKASGNAQPQDAAPSPSGEVKRRQEVKLGDLGRVLRKDQDGPFNSEGFAGDPHHQPLETFYSHVPTDWVDSREAADAYMVGSIIVYLFTGVQLQTLVGRYLQTQFHPSNWRGGYDQALVTILVDCNARALHHHLRPVLPAAYAEEIISITQSLTHPDPKLRGDPKARQQLGRPVGLDRIYQRLNLLARRCAADERGRTLA